MTKKKKVSQSITDSGNPTKNQDWQDSYLDMGHMLMRPINQAFLERLGNEWIQWSQKAGNDSLIQFVGTKYMNVDTFMRWVKKHERFREQFEFGKTFIGYRREDEQRKRGYGADMARRYNCEVREEAEKTAKLKEKSGDKSSSITVEIAPAPIPEGFTFEGTE